MMDVTVVLAGIVVSVWWIISSMNWQPTFTSDYDFVRYARGSMMCMGLFFIWLVACLYYILTR